MDKTDLTDLKKKLFIRSAMMSLDSLSDILGLNDYLSVDEILLEIFNRALGEFELTNPLILEMPITTNQVLSCTAPDGFFEIKSNFLLYLDCKIPEQRIILVPNSIPMWRLGRGAYLSNYYGSSGILGYSGSLPTPLSYTYALDYRRPYCCLDVGLMVPGEEIILRGICNRPLIPDFLPDKTFNPDSKRSALYWLDVNVNNARSSYFMDLCLAYLLDYIRQLKASIQLSNVPVDVLSNVDGAYQELRARCDQYSAQSGWYGELLM